MRAVVCREFGNPSALVLGAAEAPVPAAGEVLVEVHAAAVTYMDALMAAGKYQMRPPLPYVPGSDAAGVVAAVGPGVERLQPGDRVACGHWHGAWGERMVADQYAAARLPPEVDFVTGAAVLHGYGTARYALVSCARLQQGETVFVSGAAGGVGLAAVDLARHLGARVIAGIGSADKEEVVRSRGAHEVVNYRDEDLKERIKALTAGQGVDVCFDNVGGEVFAAMTRAMNWGGRMLPIGFTSGEIPGVPANLLLLKNYSVVGSFWGAWRRRFPRDSAAADEEIMRLVAAGALRPLVEQVLPLEDFGLALQRLQQRQTRGRIVLQVREAGPREAPAALQFT